MTIRGSTGFFLAIAALGWVAGCAGVNRRSASSEASATGPTAVAAPPQDLAAFLPMLIRPDSFVPVPNPFPIDTPADRSSLAMTRARNTAPRVWAMQHARPCRPVSLADTTGWESILPTEGPRPSAVTAYPGAGLGRARIILPPAFTRDTAFRSYHGGYGWAAGETKFRMESGYWGVQYAGKIVTACRVVTAAGAYVVQESMQDGRYSFYAFPVDSVWRPSVMISGVATTEQGLRGPWTAFALMTPP